MKDIPQHLLLGLWIAIPAGLHAQAPQWREDPYAGLDRSMAIAGIGQADFLPDMRISSAMAYAQAVRALSESLGSIISSRERVFAEQDSGQAESAVKNLVKSPLGSALTKSYGSENADDISVAISARRWEDRLIRLYAQESSNTPSKTLCVRLVLSKSTADYLLMRQRYNSSKEGIMAAALGLSSAPTNASDARAMTHLQGKMAKDNAVLEKQLNGSFVLWPGANLRLVFQDTRIGKNSEYTLWVEDNDLGLSWVEHWPAGGADLLKDNEVLSKYVYERTAEQWIKVSDGAGVQ